MVYQDKDGWQYRIIGFSEHTKTLWYEVKKPNERWAGPFHGRLQRDFDLMKIVS